MKYLQTLLKYIMLIFLTYYLLWLIAPNIKNDIDITYNHFAEKTNTIILSKLWEYKLPLVHTKVTTMGNDIVPININSTKTNTINTTSSGVHIVEGNKNIKDFTTAKNILEKKLFNGIVLDRVDKYCGCPYNSNKKINFETCWFSTTWGSYWSRSYSIEWEHIVPAENFWSLFSEWVVWSEKCIDSKGNHFKWRKCANTNETFNKLEWDLYNLVPVIWEMNAIRTNHDYGIVTQIIKTPWKCESKIGDKIFEPRDEFKWWAWRASLYMNSIVQWKLFDKSQLQMFSEWNEKFPPTQEECKYAESIKQIQWNENPYIVSKCH